MNNNTPASTSVKKYRPSLTACQIDKIMSLAKQETPLSEASKDIIRTLAPFLAKIETGATSPAYEYIPSLSLSDMLGIESDTSVSNSCTGAEYNKQCYLKCQTTPALCSPVEIAAAQEHAYINDLMSASEEQDYEAKIKELEDTLRNSTGA